MTESSTTKRKAVNEGELIIKNKCMTFYGIIFKYVRDSDSAQASRNGPADPDGPPLFISYDFLF